jgi:hypothetical protein
VRQLLNVVDQTGEFPPYRAAYLLGFALERFAGAASGLGGIAGQLDAVERKQLPAN